MNRPEILAPAGAPDRLLPAARCGADAVYLALRDFGARASAENFTADELRSAVSFCHARNMKVYVAVNTLVTDEELPDVSRTIREIASSGADAVIVQDLGVLRLARELCPSLKISASTQMSVCSLDGARAAAELGCYRVVLARELTLGEIASVTRGAGLQTEVFVHGALCMSVSGQCLLSAMIGGRSGNRGRCAQPCRLDFSYRGVHSALSLKDLSALDKLPALAAAGVAAFKLEGRMKRPEYVALATDAAVRARDGEEYDPEPLRQVFSRSGFTSGYPDGRRDGAMFGVRTKEDALDTADALRQAHALYRRELPRVPLTASLTIDARQALLTVRDGGDSYTAAAPSEPAERPLDAEAARRQIAKTGDTPYFFESIDVNARPGFTIRFGALGAMRRQALDALTEKRGRTTPHPVVKEAVDLPAGRTVEKGKLYARFACADGFADVGADLNILPITALLKAPELTRRAPFAAELPLTFEDGREELYDALESLGARGVTDVFCGDLGTVKAALDRGFTVHGAFGLNVTNSLALETYARMGLADCVTSVELRAKQIAALRRTMPVGAVCYGYLPLMKLRACPARAFGGCAQCGGRSFLTDRKGNRFPLECREKKHAELLNCVPVYIGDRDRSFADFELLYFTRETPARVRRVAEMRLAGERFDGPHTGGLYYRTLL